MGDASRQEKVMIWVWGRSLSARFYQRIQCAWNNICLLCSLIWTGSRKGQKEGLILWGRGSFALFYKHAPVFLLKSKVSEVFFSSDKLQMEVIGTVYCYKGRTNPILAPTLWGQPYTKFKNFVLLTSGDLKKNINNLFKVWFSKFLNIWYWTNYIPFVHYPDSIRFGQIGKFFSSALCPQSKFVSICWKSWCQEFTVDNSVWAFICISTDSRNSAKIDNDQFHSEDFRQE